MALFNSLKDKAAEAARKAAEAASHVGESAAESARKVADAATNAWEATSSAAVKGWEATAKSAEDAWEASGKSRQEFAQWAKDIPDTVTEFKDNFSPDEFWQKIKGSLASAGHELVARALLIYYTVFTPDDNKSDNENQH